MSQYAYQLVLHVRLREVVARRPIRRTRRSVLGCVPCKRRKVKCDETPGRCNNCVRNRLQCEYPSAAPLAPKEAKGRKRAPQDPANPQLDSREGSTDPREGSSDPRDPNLDLIDPRDLTELREDLTELQTADLLLTKLDPKDPADLREDSLLTQLDPSDPTALGVIMTTTLPPFGRGLYPLPVANNFHGELQLDEYFFAQFAHTFLPTIARPHFHQSKPQHGLLLAAADRLAMLRRMFIACGALLVAGDDASFYAAAHTRYNAAVSGFVRGLKRGHFNNDWFFVAVQVLQLLCLRDSFGGDNATRCAAHFGAAHQILTARLLPGRGPVLPLQKMMVENFLFNYSLTVFFCAHAALNSLVPDPFAFFAAYSRRLGDIARQDGLPAASRVSLLAFQIAAKCSWLCRLKLPLAPHDQLLHIELLQLADTALMSLDADVHADTRLRNTASIAKVTLRACIILLRKMLDMHGTSAHDLQGLVRAIQHDVADPCNADIIFPIWSLMTAASTALAADSRAFFRDKLHLLVHISRSQICRQIINHLDALWQIYDGDEPFELLFDTDVLDKVCQ